MAPSVGVAKAEDTQEPKQRRAQILFTIQGSPGLHFNEIRRRTGMAQGIFQHYIDQLVHDGLVGGVPHGNRILFYPAGHPALVALSTAPIDERILGWISAHPDSTPKELGAVLSLPTTTVKFHLKKLTEAGKLEASKKGRSNAYSLAPRSADSSRHTAAGESIMIQPTTVRLPALNVAQPRAVTASRQVAGPPPPGGTETVEARAK